MEEQFLAVVVNKTSDVDKEYEYMFNDTNYIMHNDYKTASDGAVHNDIAVIRINGDNLLPNDYPFIKINADSDKPEECDNSFALGFGLTVDNVGSQPKRLREVSVPAVGFETCNASLADFFSTLDENIHLCAGLDDGGRVRISPRARTVAESLLFAVQYCLTTVSLLLSVLCSKIWIGYMRWYV